MAKAKEGKLWIKKKRKYKLWNFDVYIINPQSETLIYTKIKSVKQMSGKYWINNKTLKKELFKYAQNKLHVHVRACIS